MMTEDIEYDFEYDENGISDVLKVTIPNFWERYERGTIFSLDNLDIRATGWQITLESCENRKVSVEENGFSEWFICGLDMPTYFSDLSFKLCITPLSEEDTFTRRASIRTNIEGPESQVLFIDKYAMNINGTRTISSHLGYTFKENDSCTIVFTGQTAEGKIESPPKESTLRVVFRFLCEKSKDDVWNPGQNIKG